LSSVIANRLASLAFVDEVVLRRLERFGELLEEWGSVHNFTASNAPELIAHNIFDSIYVANRVAVPQRLLDVGTGAGFPGLVLAAYFSSSEVVLCEPLKKRAAFLRYVAMELGLDGVEVAQKRVEALNDSPFDLITSRAVTDTKLLLSLTSHLSSPKSSYLFYKGSRLQEELEAIALPYEIYSYNQRQYLYIKGVPPC